MSTIMNVFAKMPSGKYILLGVKKDLTVASLKKMFYLQTKIPTTEKLYFCFRFGLEGTFT